MIKGFIIIYYNFLKIFRNGNMFLYKYYESNYLGKFFLISMYSRVIDNDVDFIMIIIFKNWEKDVGEIFKYFLWKVVIYSCFFI